MPELPEVETVRHDLSNHIRGAKLSGVQLYRANLRYPFPKRFAERLDNAKVNDVKRRGKYILIELDAGEVWVTHLGMTGHFTFCRAQQGSEENSSTRPPDLHFQCLAAKGRSTTTVRYFDRRRFGFMQLVKADRLMVEPWFADLGIEPLSDTFDVDFLLGLTRARRTSLKSLLMDQTGIAGLGNIYSCEALWEAKLNPERQAGTLNASEAAALVAGIKASLGSAVDAGLAYLKTDGGTGRDGYFAYDYKVYDREGQACYRKDGGTIRRGLKQGRSTYYCPVCQT